MRPPADYKGEGPTQVLLIDIPEAKYIVFEHGPFDYVQESRNVEEKINEAIRAFDFAGAGYCYESSFGKIAYFYHDPARFWKEIRPVKRV